MSNILRRISISIGVILSLPNYAFATDAFDVVEFGIDAFSDIARLGLSLAVIVFLWGIVKFVAHAGDEKAVEEGKEVIVYGLVAIFVIVSLWGIVGFIQGNFDLSSGGGDSITIPTGG